MLGAFDHLEPVRWRFDDKITKTTEIVIFTAFWPPLKNYETFTQWVIGETTKAPSEKAGKIPYYYYEFIISVLGYTYPVSRGVSR